MRFSLLIWLLLCFSCIAPKKNSHYKTFRITGFAQGTSYQITYYAAEETVKKSQIEEILSSVDSSLSVYRSYSLISRFNESKKGTVTDRHLKKVVQKSLEITKKTGGAFDISIQPLVQAWGFGTEAITALPDSATIRRLLDCVGPEKIRLHKNYLQKQDSCVRIDVNGIAQGYTVDVLAEYLQEKGIRNFLVEIGGEVRVNGQKPGGELMAIGIEGPELDSAGSYPIRTIIRPPNGAITTSGNYRKFLQTGTRKFSHLIDPKTGYPVQNEMISITVWAKDAITADGYDNALMGMGMEKALKFAEGQKDLEAYIIYTTADGLIADTASTAFYKWMN